jgi:hypothetical protein
MPLTIKRDTPFTKSHFHVYSGDANIGVIMQHVEWRGAPWRWIIHFPSTNHPPSTRMNGHGHDYEDCKRQFAEAWRAWCDLAALTDKAGAS